MVALTAWTGGILSVTGIVAYLVTGMESFTALIPTVVGVLLLIAALVAYRVPSARRHAVHAALVIALLGALGSLMNVAKIGDLFSGDAERPAAIVVSCIMFVLLLAFLAAGIRSFVAARAQKSQEAQKTQQ